MNKKIALSISLCAIAPALAETPAVTLDGYRAVYEVSFDSAQVNSGIIGAEGRYVFDVENACEGYATNERFVVSIARTEDRVVQDYRLSAFEAVDGGQYRFSRTVESNGHTGQKAKGELRVEAEQAELDYEDSDDRTFDERILTPVAHVREIIQTALAGETRHAAMIFDGDIDSPVFYTVTRIGEAGDAAGPEIEGAEDLAALQRWKIDSVYYPPETGGEGEGATPQFAFGAILYENGVVTDLALDYIDFQLTGQLSALELRETACG